MSEPTDPLESAAADARIDLATLPLADLRTLADALNEWRYFARRTKAEWQRRRCNAFKHNPSFEAECARNADAWQGEEMRAARLWEVVRTLHNAEVRRLKAMREQSAETT